VRSTGRARVGISPSFTSIVRGSRVGFSRPSSTALRGEPIRALTRLARAASRQRPRAPSSSMRSVSCRSRDSRSSCGSSKKAPGSDSARHARAACGPGWSRPPIATWCGGWRIGAFVPISTTDCAFSRWRFPHCAIAGRISPTGSSARARVLPRAWVWPLPISSARPSIGCALIAGRAICASSSMSWRPPRSAPRGAGSMPRSWGDSSWTRRRTSARRRSRHGAGRRYRLAARSGPRRGSASSNCAKRSRVRGETSRSRPGGSGSRAARCEIALVSTMRAGGCAVAAGAQASAPRPLQTSRSATRVRVSR
jgi:hypothetical protein